MRLARLPNSRSVRAQYRAWLGWSLAVAASCLQMPAAALEPDSGGCCDDSTQLAVSSVASGANVAGDTSTALASSPGSPSASSTQPEIASAVPMLTLGVGDAVSVQVYGRPELATTTYVADDGTIPVPLAGNVQVAGLSPSQAGQHIAAAFSRGKYLVDPHVTVFLVQFRSQQVSVLGAVHAPGRFVIESKTTLLDLLAQAGGTNDNSASQIVLLRANKNGAITRYPIEMAGLSHENMPLPTLALRGGDTIFVPVAEQFYISGEVRSPNMYRFDPGMTVAQAIARGGGITALGSTNRIEITRRKPDGSSLVSSGELSEVVQANDVIRIKERIF